MRKIAIIILSLFIISCSSDVEESNIATTNSIVVADFLTDISVLEKMNTKTPIADFEELAKGMASKVLDMDKDNIESVLTEAKNYAHCVIITGNHTIVKIISFDDCKTSSSWGACMPFAEGYIKKGDLVEQKDYINNIIGRPDNQTRTVYLFE